MAADDDGRPASGASSGVNWRSACLVFFLTLVAFGLGIAAFAHDSGTQLDIRDGRAYATQDAAVYVQMAEHPGTIRLLPFVQRPLEPWLVSASHADPLVGFKVLTTVLVAAAAASTFILLRRFTDERRAVAATVLMLVTYPVMYLIRDPFSTDPVALLSVSLGLLLIVRRKWWWLAVMLLVATMARETALYVLLPAAGMALHDRRRPSLGLVAAMVSPFVALFVVRTPHVFYPETIPFGTEKRPGEILTFLRLTEGSVLRAVVIAVIGGLGVVAVLAVAGFRRSPPEARLCSLVLVPCVLSMALASDWMRLLGFSLPALVLLAVAAPIGRKGIWIAVGTNCLVSIAAFRSIDNLAGLAVVLVAVGSGLAFLLTPSDPRHPARSVP